MKSGTRSRKNATDALDRWQPTPLTALGQSDIPTELHFVRDHFPVPALDPEAWSMTLTGSEQSLALDLALLQRLPPRTLSVVLECAGHRRTELEPTPPGVPWGTGAVTEAKWTGASLASLLELVGIPSDAQEVVLEGADGGAVKGFDGHHSFARSLPLAKALHPDVLLAYGTNGDPIPVARGGPVRAIVPGWYATDSVKWLERVWFVSSEFGGVFQAHDYRLRALGDPGPGERMTELPVHALITAPADGVVVEAGGELSVRGTAWGGTDGIASVLMRIDGGPWMPARLASPRGAYGRLAWTASCSLAPGSHEIACRAIDRAGNWQPDSPPANVGGYANNAIHRVRVQAVQIV